MRLRGKIAIITGGGSGFGEGIARKMNDEGAKVVIVDLDIDKAERVAAFNPQDARALAGDVSKPDAMAQARDLAITAFGGLDIVVNNAGVSHKPTPADQVDEDLFERVIDVNMRSIYHTTRAVVPFFKKQRSGAILNIASTGGVSPRPNLTWYNASKGWVITATRSLAVELAPAGIRVNAINPVAGETAMLAGIMGDDPAVRERFLGTIPIGRFSTPEDMGNAAAFLCSDEASMITGIALNVDGGRCI